MILLIGVNEETVVFRAFHYPEVRTFEITTDRELENCRPLEAAVQVMFWLCPDGVLGAVETIFPEVVNQAPSEFSEKLWRHSGTPLLEISGEAEAAQVQVVDSNSYAIWIGKGEIDEEVVTGDIRFLFARRRLVGIVAEKYEVSYE